MYLPDSNIFILALKKETSESTFLTKLITKRQLYISVVVIGEFLAKADEKEGKAFLNLTNTFTILPVDQEVAKIAADYRKQMGQKTKRIVLLDCFLAAQAKLHHLTLVTNNRADFPMKDIKVISP